MVLYSLALLGLGFFSLGALWLGLWFVDFSFCLLFGTLCILHVYLVHLFLCFESICLFTYQKRKSEPPQNGVVADGRRVKFWKEVWSRDSPLCDSSPFVFLIAASKEAWVAVVWEALNGKKGVGTPGLLETSKIGSWVLFVY